MEKQTAIEWLLDRIEDVDNSPEIWELIKYKAKEMEKQQIIDAYKEGCFDNILDEKTDKVRAEQYYSETFNK
jgi:HEPN domain-containing protein